jgi:hypothetical protein
MKRDSINIILKKTGIYGFKKESSLVTIIRTKSGIYSCKYYLSESNIFNETFTNILVFCMFIIF